MRKIKSALKAIYRLIKKDIKKFKKQSVSDKFAIPGFLIALISLFMVYTVSVKQDMSERAIAELTRLEYQNKSEVALATSLRRINCLAQYSSTRIELSDDKYDLVKFYSDISKRRYKNHLLYDEEFNSWPSSNYRAAGGTFFQSVDRHIHLYSILVEIRSQIPEKELARIEQICSPVI